MHFDGIYSSDLSVSFKSCHIALGLPKAKIIKKKKKLREINFGYDEGKHFKSLSKFE